VLVAPGDDAVTQQRSVHDLEGRAVERGQVDPAQLRAEGGRERRDRDPGHRASSAPSRLPAGAPGTLPRPGPIEATASAARLLEQPARACSRRACAARPAVGAGGRGRRSERVLPCAAVRDADSPPPGRCAPPRGRRTRRRAPWLVGAAVGLAAFGCGGERREGDGRPSVVASVPPHCWLVARLAGDAVRCEVMLPPGANPASHQPSLGELRAVEDAMLYVRVGHPNFAFERSWFDALTRGRDALRSVELSAASGPRAGDPHEWLDPGHMRAAAERLAQPLGALLPAVDVDARLERLRHEIDALDTEIRNVLAPVRGRAFFVFHPAWGHFADAYGLEQVSIERDRKSPGARDLARLIERARRERIRVVFSEPQFDGAAARTLAREIGARVEILDPLAYDWAANLRRSARVIAEALQP